MATTRPLREDTRSFIEHLAFLYLQHRRPARAAALFALLVPGCADDDPLRGALALAQLRSGNPKQALATWSRIAPVLQVGAPCQLLRAQILHALGSDDEAALAVRAFEAARAEQRRRSALTQPPRGANDVAQSGEDGINADTDADADFGTGTMTMPTDPVPYGRAVPLRADADNTPHLPEG